jgi:hypothetical protein
MLSGSGSGSGLGLGVRSVQKLGRKAMGLSEERLGELEFSPLSLIPIKKNTSSQEPEPNPLPPARLMNGYA